MSSRQMFPDGSTSRKLLTSRWTLLPRCHVWERENSAGKLVAARTKSLFLQFWLFSFKNKNGAHKETFYSSYRRWNCKIHCRKRLHKHLKRHMDCCTFVSPISFLYNELYCFKNCGLFCLCYIRKHLMTVPLGNICFVSLEPKCFSIRSRWKHLNSRETKQMFPSREVINCIMLSVLGN